jgi:RimJ/RimL family protein N-acetyltransferase
VRVGKRVVLRAIEREDLKFLHKWRNDEEVMRLARSLPDHTTSMVALEAEYEKLLKGEEPTQRDYIIDDRETGTPIGWAGLRIHQWPRKAVAHSADLGLAVGEKDRWRRGIGTEVVQLLLAEAFEQLNLHKVVWWTFAEHSASLALARKMGFREECRVRDSVFFDNRWHDSIGLGLLKSEYEKDRGEPGGHAPAP